MFIAFIVLGHGGVVVHLRNRSRMDLYHSPPAWMAAIAINAFGAVLHAVAVVWMIGALSGRRRPLAGAR